MICKVFKANSLIRIKVISVDLVGILIIVMVADRFRISSLFLTTCIYLELSHVMGKDDEKYPSGR